MRNIRSETNEKNFGQRLNLQMYKECHFSLSLKEYQYPVCW